MRKRSDRHHLGNSFSALNLPIGMRGSVVYSAAAIEPSAIR